MKSICRAALILLALGSSPIGAVASIGGDDEKAKDLGSRQPGLSIASRFAAIKSEFAAEQDRLREALEKINDPAEANRVNRKLGPDEVAYCRRMVELAATAPADPGARDALIWVIDHPGRSEVGPFGDLFARAAALLVRHHGDDPEAVRIGLGIDNNASFQRDALLYGFLAAAKGREQMGLARLAMAQYLEQKAKFAHGTRNMKARAKYKLKGVMDDYGKLVDKEREQSAEEFAYILALRESDPAKLRAEAERLYEEVASDYSDVPHITLRHREIEALAKAPNPTWNGKPLSDDERKQLAELVGRKQTLGQVAEGRLDEMHNLVVGKPAPEIDGVDFEGKPLKLSDYQGKVVALVFWGTWCGPCMRAIPGERDLVERLKGKPFALLGINCDGDKQAAIKAISSERITWPNWHDGAPDTGPIARRYHVRSYPTVLVLDARGIIRHKDLHGDAIGEAVEKILAAPSAEAGPTP